MKLSDIIRELENEAARIEIVQRELVASGIRIAPDQGQLLRKAAYEAGARVLQFCRDDKVIVTRLREHAERAAAEHVAAVEQPAESEAAS